MTKFYVPCTPAGTPCTWIADITEEKAWANLMLDASHMPYTGIDAFKARGYTVEEWDYDPR